MPGQMLCLTNFVLHLGTETVLGFFVEMAAMAELFGRLIPMASIAEAIVLAVYIPPQEPAPGIDLDSISSNCYR